MTNVPLPDQETDTDLRPRQKKPGPEPTKTDLVAFFGVLALAALMVIVGALARTGAGQAGDWTAALVVACFGVWLRLRHTPDRRWTNGAVSFTSPNGRFRATRAWGTEGCADPALPDLPPPPRAPNSTEGSHDPARPQAPGQPAPSAQPAQ